MGSPSQLDAAVVTCRACPRLVTWWEEARAGQTQGFWGGRECWARPVPGFGPAEAPLVIVGLAPAAHGGNCTGRIFTGDTSADALYAALPLATACRPHFRTGACSSACRSRRPPRPGRS
ncbi:uracil-DNA glycosylase family protein [Streptomyces sp. CoH27]|uniref:uracil-DNA glycosylase family protein n=1 Tax=Streptomyces sp. CoH27 TaxID=2875763 RepID=UPI0035A8B5BB